MKKFFILICITPLLLACPKNPPEDWVLVFSKTEAYVHESIPVGNSALNYMGKQNNFLVVETKDASQFNSENLKKYKAVVFLNTTGDVLNEDEQNALKFFIRDGGGFVGIHAASDTEYDWPWYGRMLGGYFESHPDQQLATLKHNNRSHYATRELPKTFEIYEEWYNFKELQPYIDVLLTVDESSYEGGKHGEVHPVSWYHVFEGGRVFYTSLGHRKETYSNDLFLNHVLGGIQYVIGNDIRLEK